MDTTRVPGKIKDMRKIYFLLIVVSLSHTAFTQSVFIADSGQVSFFSSAPLEDIKAVSNQVNSMINITNGEVAFMIPMRSFKFAKALMQEHFNEKFIESEKYPHASFKGRINEKIDLTKKGVVSVTATGKLTIHGVERDVSEQGELEVLDATLILRTKFMAAVADYKIEIPQLLFNNIADTVEVKLSAIYYPYKNK